MAGYCELQDWNPTPPITIPIPNITTQGLCEGLNIPPGPYTGPYGYYWNESKPIQPTPESLTFPIDSIAPDGLLSSFQIADTLPLENILAIGLVVLCFGMGFLAGNTR